MKPVPSFFRLMLTLFASTIFLFVDLCAQDVSSSQSEDLLLKINDIQVNKKEQRVEVFLNAKQNNQSLSKDQCKFSIWESVAGGPYEAAALDIINDLRDGNSRSNASIIFLLDVSGSMRKGDKIGEAKKTIKEILDKNNLPQGTTYLATFGNTVSSSRELTRENYKDEVEPIVAKDNFTDLYAAIQEKLGELSSTSGTKAIILLTDGKDDQQDGSKINPKYADGIVPIVQRETVLQGLTNASDDTRVYTIGYGIEGEINNYGLDADFLRAVTESTPNKKDTYHYTTGPELSEILQGIIEDVEVNMRLDVYPAQRTYTGLPRNLLVALDYGGQLDTAILEYSYGSSGAGATIERTKSADESPVLLVGLAIIAALLALLIYLVPVIGIIQFRKKYVMPYGEYRAKTGRTNPNIKIKDPYSHDVHEDDTLIVTKCEHLMSWESWEYNGHKCVNYPEKCAVGVGNYGNKGGFFRQQGVNRRLNWLWFGAVGGFASWLAFKLLNWKEISFLYDTIKTNFSTDADSLYRQVLLGIALGGMLSLFLAMVEELGQGRKVSVWRIITRAILGGLISLPIFFFEEWLYNNVLKMEYLGGLVGWLLFGTALGFIVTINSSIETMKGIKGGALASLVAFQVYYIAQQFISPLYANVIGYICFGAILAVIIVAVVETLEKFELSIVSPAHFAGRKIAISKWLTRPDSPQIYIGTEDSCHVFIKWLDEAVQGRHASLSFDGQVHLTPIAETLINGRILNSGDRTQLNDGDLIQLGRLSSSMFKYHIKEKRQLNDGQLIRNAEDSVRKSPEELQKEEAIKSNIKIKIKR